jgi:nitroreductase
MDVYEAIQSRFSVRSYEDEPVEEDKLQRVLEAARSAPTARNRQMWKLVVVRNETARKALADAAGQSFIGEAPVLLAMVGLTPADAMFCKVPTDPVDCAIVLDHVTLAAVAEGLGTCWIGHFDQEKCATILGVPKTAKIVGLMPLGYPAVSPSGKSRKPLEKLVCHDKFA